MDSNANAFCEIVSSSITKMLALHFVILCQEYHKNAFKNNTMTTGNKGNPGNFRANKSQIAVIKT